LLKEAARGSPQARSKQELDRILEGIQECEGALEVLELVACDVTGIPMSPGVRQLYDQAQELLLQHRRDQQAGGEEMDGRAEEPDQQLDATLVDTQEQEPTLREEKMEREEAKKEEQGQEEEERKMTEQPDKQEQPLPATPARRSTPPRVYTSPQSSPPPKEAAGDAPQEPAPVQGQQQPEAPEQNGHKQNGDLPVVKTEPTTSNATQQSSSSSSALKSGRRDEDEAAVDRAAKRARSLLIDLTLDDDDNDYLTGAAASRPPDGEEHSLDSVVHYAEHSNPPRPQPRLDLPRPYQGVQDDVGAPHSPASNFSTQMDDGGDNDAPGFNWSEGAPEDTTVISGAADTQSQFTEMTQDTLPADDPEYEPSQEIDMNLLSQSPRTTRSSVGPSQESPDRGGRTNLAAQLEVSNHDPQIGNEPEYYRAFTCEHEYCRSGRCEMVSGAFVYGVPGVCRSLN
jgi:hypothetical protein